MTSYAASYSGPSVGDFLANPPYPNFDLASVYGVATQYIGTPYVYGGATPAGFDCSGFVMYVYAQFGVSMPHSSTGQGAMGTRISEADAQPGDLVIMDGHDGFYAGNGMILHAPYEGASVRVQPLWTSDYYIVRIGI
jgi:peptidoglycan DL-endopeptidase CwlO